MTRRTHVLLGLAATVLNVATLLYVVNWSGERLFGHVLELVPDHLEVVILVAGTGLIATVAWFQESRPASADATLPAPGRGFRVWRWAQRATLLLLLFLQFLVLFFTLRIILPAGE